MRVIFPRLTHGGVVKVVPLSPDPPRAFLTARAHAGRCFGLGYLLNDRVRDVGEFINAVERVARGGTAFDPAAVSSLVGQRRRSALDDLNARERTDLSLLAEGLSNRAVAKHMYLSSRAIERHVQAIFQTPGLAQSGTSTAGSSRCSLC
jgi:DNA-binding NarL/FixJ family response regulator